MIGFKVVPGDVIISCSGVTLGRIAEVPTGAKKGIINAGTNAKAAVNAAAKVLFVSAKTRNERAKFPATPPIAPRVVATIISVKFFVQSLFFIFSSPP